MTDWLQIKSLKWWNHLKDWVCGGDISSVALNSIKPKIEKKPPK